VGVKQVRRERPVVDYLKTQGRYKHLFKAEGGAEVLAKLQAMADANAAKFGLLD